MSVSLLGAPPAARILASVKSSLATRPTPPHLAIVQVGDRADSTAYVRRKRKAAEAVGIRVTHHHTLSPSHAELVGLVRGLSADPAVDGILVQLPLPDALQARTDEVIAAIDPRKDVDGLTPINLGRLLRGQVSGTLLPATALGIIELLHFYHVPLRGAHVVIVGRSLLVGRPLSQLCLLAGATVTVCHRQTPDLSVHTKQADILVVATGSAHLITADMVQPKATVIDVGINRVGEQLVGDVHPGVADVVAACSPVPGGVGPLTVACLLRNVAQAALLTVAD